MPTLPFPFQCTFEDGLAVPPFSSLTNGNSKAAVRHYTYLAQHPPLQRGLPWQGAYAWHLDLSLGAADTYLEATSGFDTAGGAVVAARLYFWASSLTMAVNDRFTICALESAAGTNEVSISVMNSAGTIVLVGAETGAVGLGAATRVTPLIQDQWHCLELLSTIDSGANNGTIAFYCDGAQVGTAITGLTQLAIVHGRFGAIGVDATTTSGHLLFDQIVGDTARIGPLARRFSERRILTKTGHAVLGSGALVWANLIMSAALDETVALWDTDQASTLDLSKRLVVFNDTDLVPFKDGVYAVIGGTNPLVEIRVGWAEDMSPGGLTNVAMRRSV